MDLEDNVGEQVKGVKGHTRNPFDTLDASNKLNLKYCIWNIKLDMRIVQRQLILCTDCVASASFQPVISDHRCSHASTH